MLSTFQHAIFHISKNSFGFQVLLFFIFVFRHYFSKFLPCRLLSLIVLVIPATIYIIVLLVQDLLFMLPKFSIVRQLEGYTLQILLYNIFLLILTQITPLSKKPNDAASRVVGISLFLGGMVGTVIYIRPLIANGSI